MSKTIRNLALLLSAQAVFIVLAWSFSGGNKHKAETFLSLNFEQVNKVVIASTDGEVLLQKNKDLWFLPQYGGLQAVENKLEQAVEKLLENTVTWPASTTESALERFEVADDNAQKTVTFYKDNEALATLRLGTSPGYKKVHARLNENSQVFAIDFSQHELPGKSEEWFNRSLLKFDGSIQAVKTPAFNLQKIDDQWSLSTLKDGNSVNDDNVQQWLDRFSRLVVTSRVGDTQLEEITVQDAAFKAEISGEDAQGNEQSRNYAFYKNGDKFYIKLLGENHLFEIAQYSVEPIIDVDPSSFERSEEEQASGQQPIESENGQVEG